MEYIDMLFRNGGETYTKDEIKLYLSQHMSDEEAENIISEAERLGFIYLANNENGIEVYVR